MMRPSFKLKQLRTDGRSIERTWTDVLTGYQEELLYERELELQMVSKHEIGTAEQLS